MKNRGVLRLQKILSGIFWAWVFVCLVTPYLPNRSLIHNLFTYVPPFALCVPALLVGLVLLVRASMKLFNRLDFANLVIVCLSSLSILGFQFHWHRAHQDGTLRILTINVEMGNRDVPGLKEAIEEGKIDLVMMQEVKGGAESPAAKILRDFPTWHLATAGEVTILSRWPLADVRTFPLRSVPGRFILAAKVEAPKPFMALTTHWSVPQISKGFKGLTNTISSQIHDFEDTSSALDRYHTPLIIGGDFNNPPRQGLSGMMSGRLTDAFSGAGTGFGWTYSSTHLVVRIDHLYSSQELVPTFAEVGPSFGSDHYSLYTEYLWRDRLN